MRKKPRSSRRTAQAGTRSRERPGRPRFSRTSAGYSATDRATKGKAWDPGSTTIGEIASPDPVTVQPDDDLDRALQLMARHRVRRLPVVEGDRLVGIVAQADVARRGDREETGQVVEEISA